MNSTARPSRNKYSVCYLRRLIRSVCKQCGAGTEKRRELLENVHAVSRYELWNTVQRMVNWFCEQDRPFMFSRRAVYQGTSHFVEAEDMAGDFMEMTALWIGHRSGIYAREGALFPISDYEKGATLALVESFLNDLFEGVPFGWSFPLLEPESKLATYMDALYCKSPEARIEGWRAIRSHITLQALEVMVIDILQCCSGGMFRHMWAFFEARMKMMRVRITVYHVVLWFAEFLLFGKYMHVRLN